MRLKILSQERMARHFSAVLDAIQQISSVFSSDLWRVFNSPKRSKGRLKTLLKKAKAVQFQFLEGFQRYSVQKIGDSVGSMYSVQKIFRESLRISLSRAKRDLRHSLQKEKGQGVSAVFGWLFGIQFKILERV